jgi:hypothetical protein
MKLLFYSSQHFKALSIQQSAFSRKNTLASAELLTLVLHLVPGILRAELSLAECSPGTAHFSGQFQVLWTARSAVTR